ncbi:hypothetical protein IAT38_000819 [Cryptococcus sp. DSM 104549]
MYWYISFLRPPPVTVTLPSEGITITPQVANDLRTELRYDPTPIHYTWQRLLPTPSSPLPAKTLTTFLPPASTYKPILVPLPAGAQLGESWRLGLFVPATGGGRGGGGGGPSSGLLELIDGPRVMGVWSEGIVLARGAGAGPGSGSGSGVGAIKGRGKEKEKDAKGKAGKGKGKAKEEEGAKQGRILREWGLPSPGEEAGRLRIVEQTSFDLDKKIWDSGLALSAWFWKYLPSAGGISSSGVHPLGQAVLGLLNRDEALRVVELGSGTGLVSIVLGMALEKSRGRTGDWRKITATDLDSAIPLMDENLALNSVPALSTSAGDDNTDVAIPPRPAVQLDAKVLDWESPLPGWVSSDWPELIVAADVTYNTDSFPYLLSTLTALLRPSPTHHTGPAPLLVLAYKQRDPAERDLWGMLKEQGVGMVLVDEVKGAEDYGVTEIWVGGVGVGGDGGSA